MPDSVVALFCEDVRQEFGGQFTLVGVLPDNLEVPTAPGLMPKLGVYIRAVIDSSHAPQQATVKLINTDGADIPVAQWDHTLIQRGYSDAATRGTPIYGLISTAVIGPFRIPQVGMIQVVVDIDATTYVAGILNVSTSATASPPPPAPVPTAAPPSSSKP
jgi:hypothetical protein